MKTATRVAATTLGMALAAAGARADEPGRTRPTSANPLPPSWTGAYVGGQLGYAWGNSDWTAYGPAATATSGSFDYALGYDAFKGTGSYFGGLQAGYNYRLPSGIVIGVEADMVAPNTIRDTQILTSPAVGQASISEQVEMSGTLRGRLGYVHDGWLIYGTAGYAWSYDRFLRTQLLGTPVGGTAVPGDIEKANAWRNGWAAGLAVELPVAARWTASLEYLFTAYGAQSVAFPAGAQRFESDLAIQSLRMGLNYQFGDQDAKRTGPAPPDSNNWSVHAQSTYVQQYAFPFHAPYAGQNSLVPGQTRETWDATSTWAGGCGAAPSCGSIPRSTRASAYRARWASPDTSAARPTSSAPTTPTRGCPGPSFARPSTWAAPARRSRPHPTSWPARRRPTGWCSPLESSAVTDVFDTNKYAHDARSDFLNWAIIDTGSFDYASDAWGFTYGAAVEWYQGPWTFRGGLFDLSIVPNSTELDPSFEQVQWVGEIERRYELWGKPGKLAVTGFLTRGRMGSFEDAIRQAQLTGLPADIAAVRQYRSRTGLSFNLEQQLASDLGVFARGGFASGNVEPYEFTDVDSTIAAGIVLAGKRWGRPDDTIGLAGVINGISGKHEAFLNAGGLGILVGDGKLPNPGTERIVEVYYSLPVTKSSRLTFDYQLIDNPAYNQDRGPVSVIGTRLRAQF